MILVSQGHEKGVGLEVFLKAMAMAPTSWFQQTQIFSEKKTLLRHAKILNLRVSLETEGIRFPNGLLNCRWVKASTKLPLSSVCLEAALEETMLQPHNVLFTLPTTKDQLRDSKRPSQRHLGHTEWLRSRFKTASLGMFFTSDDLNVLLATDHLPLKMVVPTLGPRAFNEKLLRSLEHLKILEPGICRVLISGINPHAGEDGLIGKEEIRLGPSLKKLQSLRSDLQISGFYPGDTMLREQRSIHDLFVFMFHDQGLTAFKALKGTLGANVTLGLPFLRLSVDHGTAFSLYGKSMADHRGAYYCMRKAICYRERLLGQNHRLQS